MIVIRGRHKHIMKGITQAGFSGKSAIGHMANCSYSPRRLLLPTQDLQGCQVYLATAITSGFGPQHSLHWFPTEKVFSSLIIYGPVSCIVFAIGISISSCRSSVFGSDLSPASVLNDVYEEVSDSEEQIM